MRFAIVWATGWRSVAMSQTMSDYTSPRLPVFQHAILKNIGRPGYEAIIWHYHNYALLNYEINSSGAGAK